MTGPFHYKGGGLIVVIVSIKLINILVVKLKSSFRKFYGSHYDLVNHDMSQMTTDRFYLL